MASSLSERGYWRGPHDASKPPRGGGQVGLRTLMISLALATTGVGCATKPEPSKPAGAKTLPSRIEYADHSAASLAFTPAVAIGEPPVVLAREGRQPSVFIGFDEISATAFYIRTDDRQSDDMSDRYQRRSVIEKVGVTYR